MQTAKAQTIVRMRKVQAGQPLFGNIFYSVRKLCKRASKALIRLRKCAVWSGTSFSAYDIRAIFLC